MIKTAIIKFRLFSKKRKEPYLLFYNLLGFYPYKIEYYQLAMLHRSAGQPTDNGIVLSNERLEFLGDAILNSVVTDILYRRYDTQSEGFLTSTRSKIVKRETLNKLALEIGIDKLMHAGKNVRTTESTNLLGNALDAFFGAIYLDYGYKKCKYFIEQRLLRNYIDIDKLVIDEANFKSSLIEWCQKQRYTIEFVLLKEEIASANNHLFHTQITINNIAVCDAIGRSKKDSHQNAAMKALQMLDQIQLILNARKG
ncbi:MAG: ribonuclease III [Paludibacter sp.]